jgi:hypothetical protein
MDKKINSQLLRIKQINIMNSEKMILKVKVLGNTFSLQIND